MRHFLGRTQKVEAIYTSGVLKPTRKLPFRDRQRVRLTVETKSYPTRFVLRTLLAPERRRIRCGAGVGGATWHNASDVKLRNAHLAAIDRNKALDYLLNEAHPDNGGKARFFALLGFSREDRGEDAPRLVTAYFTTLDGKTAAVATVEAAAARPVTGREITHSRELTRAS